MNKFQQTIYLVATSQGLRQTAMTVVGDLVAAGFSAVALILFSRNLGPTSFGEFSVGFSIVLITSRLADAGFAAATLKFGSGVEDKKYVNQVFSLALFFKFGLAALIVVLGLLLRDQIAAFLDFQNAAILTLAFLFGWAVVAYEQVQTMLQAAHYFAQAVTINLIQSATKMLGASVLFITQVNLPALAFSIYLTAPLIPVLLAHWLLPRWFHVVRSISPEVKQKVFALVRHTSIAFIAAGIVENVDVLLVQRYLNSYEAGLYGGVLRISLLLSLVAFSLGNVLNPRVARYKTRDHRTAYIKKALVIGGAALLGFICFIPFTRLSIILSIGPEYLPASFELLILAASSFLLIATIPWIALFYSFKSNWYFSAAGILQLLIVVGGNMVFLPVLGLQAAAWTKLASRIFLFLFSVGLALWLYHKEDDQIT